MAQDSTNFAALLKTFYGPGLRNAMNDRFFAIREFQKRADPQDFVGEKADWPIRVGRNRGVGFRAEGAKVPKAGKQTSVRASETPRTSIASIKFTKQVIAKSRNNIGAFRKAATEETDRAEIDLLHDHARAILGQGRVQTDSNTTLRTGVIANVNGAPASDVITLDNQEEGSAVAITDGEMLWFEEGMLVDAIDPADGSLESAADGMEIVAIDFDARTITVDDDTGVSDNDWICRHGSYDDEYPGLRVLVNDADGDQINGTNTVPVHGVSSATQSKWQSPKVGSPTTGVSELLFQAAFTKRETRGDGNVERLEKSVILTSPAVRDEIASQLQSQKRYEGRETMLQSGWTGLKVARGIMVTDRFVPDTWSWILDFDEMLWFTLDDFDWDDEDGKVLFKTNDELAYEARFVGMHTPGVANRNSHVVIRHEAPEPLAA